MAIRSQTELPGSAVELRHLRYFVAVAEERTFSAAALRLHMAQPPLSQQVAKLELLLGVALFERTNRGAELTAAGRELLPKARAAIGAADDAVQTVRRAARGETGVVRLAYNLTASWEVAPVLLSAARRELPGVTVVARERWRGDVVIPDGPEGFDVGIGPVAHRHPALRYELLRSEPLVVAMAPDHPLAAGDPLPLAALAGERIVTFGRVAPTYHEMVLAACRAAGFEPRLDEQELFPPAGWMTLTGGRSVMFISQVAAPFARAAGAATRTLAPPVPALPIELFWRPDDASSAVERVVALVRRVAAERGWRAPSQRRLSRAA